MNEKATKPDDQGHGGGHQSFQIIIDSKHYTVEKTSMTGAEIKALAGIDPQYQLFLEMHGNEDDKTIGDGEAVAIKNGLHFFAIPATTFGFGA